MDSSLRALFARLGPIQAVGQVSSGSPVLFVLRLRSQVTPQTIDATLALTRRGMPMLQAKQAMEALLVDWRVFLEVPMVEDRDALAAELGAAGIAAAPVEPPLAIDVRGLRKRLGLTREQFAARYGLDTGAISDWETGKREPEVAARSYLRAISNAPQRVEEAYAPTPDP